MAEELYTVVAFDPGGITGWALFGVYDRAMRNPHRKILNNIAWWKAGEFTGPENSQVDEMIELVQAWDNAHIVMEDFVLRKFSTDKEMLSPVRMYARFDYGMHLYEDKRKIILQPGQLAMETITDARLEALGRLGLYNATKGQPHARDSVRHALTWLRRAKNL